MSATANDESTLPASQGDGRLQDGEINMEHEEILVDAAAVGNALNAAHEEVWSGRHHHGADAEDEDDDIGDAECAEQEDVDMIEDGYDSWDDNDDWNGLSALDMLGEEFERNSVLNGEYRRTTVTISQLTIQCSWKFKRA
jgi:hypothetical protein